MSFVLQKGVRPNAVEGPSPFFERVRGGRERLRAMPGTPAFPDDTLSCCPPLS